MTMRKCLLSKRQCHHHITAAFEPGLRTGTNLTSLPLYRRRVLTMIQGMTMAVMAAVAPASIRRRTEVMTDLRVFNQRDTARVWQKSYLPRGRREKRRESQRLRRKTQELQRSRQGDRMIRQMRLSTGLCFRVSGQGIDLIRVERWREALSFLSRGTSLCFLKNICIDERTSHWKEHAFGYSVL